MFIDVNEIIRLIEAAKDCQKRLPEDEQWLHFSDLEALLQKLIDDEGDRLDRMAKELEDRDQAKQDEAAVAANEMMEAGAAVMDWARQEKLMDDETRKIQDWPGAL
jgi:methionyl-tRNA formyltransferase